MERFVPRLFLVACLALAACAGPDDRLMPAGETFALQSGYYACAAPGRAQGFGDMVAVDEAGTRTRFFDPKTRYPRIEILGAGLHPVYQEEYWRLGRAATGVWRSQFERGHVRLFGEAEVALGDDLYARLGVLQWPYWPPGASYMGIGLAEGYRDSRSPDPAVIVMANIVVGETHYTAHYWIAVDVFLPAQPPLRDVEVVRAGLEARQDEVTAEAMAAMTAWLRTCRLTPFARAPEPYRPPAAAER